MKPKKPSKPRGAPKATLEARRKKIELVIDLNKEPHAGMLLEQAIRAMNTIDRYKRALLSIASNSKDEVAQEVAREALKPNPTV